MTHLETQSLVQRMAASTAIAISLAAIGCGDAASVESPPAAPEQSSQAALRVGDRVIVDVRDYLVLAPDGKRYRANGQGPAALQDFVIDGARNVDGEYVTVIVDARRPVPDPNFIQFLDFYGRPARPPFLFGVRKNRDPMGGTRCFSNPGRPCSELADYPPQGVPLIMGLFVTRGQDAILPGITPGATLIPEYSEWRAFDVVRLDFANCAETQRLGTIWHRTYASVADSIDFGALGVRSNVLVIEAEAASVRAPTPDQIVVEKYFYVPGVGRIREQGKDFRNGFVTITDWTVPLNDGDHAPARACPYAQNAF